MYTMLIFLCFTTKQLTVPTNLLNTIKSYVYMRIIDLNIEESLTYSSTLLKNVQIEKVDIYKTVFMKITVKMEKNVTNFTDLMKVYTILNFIKFIHVQKVIFVILK